MKQKWYLINSNNLILIFSFQLLDMLKAYAEFEIDEGTGEALNIHNRIDLHYNRVLALQVNIFISCRCCCIDYDTGVMEIID